jgi:hypothetical protein
MYAYRQMDEDFVTHYFPELPQRMDGHERDSIAIKTVSELEQEAHEAWQKLENEQKQFRKREAGYL